MGDSPHSGKIQERIAHPVFRGAFDQDDAKDRGLTLNTVKVGSITLNALFDPETKILYDARFFTYVPILIAIVDQFLEMARGLPISRLSEVTGNRVEFLLRDDPEIPAVDPSRSMYFDEIVKIVKALEDNMNTALALSHASTSAREGGLSVTEHLSQKAETFCSLPEFAQRIQIEEVLDRFIRPGLAVDGGNVILEQIEDGQKLTLTYEGNCGSCGISAGATLAYIERTIRREIHDRVEVIATNASSAWMNNETPGTSSPFGPPPMISETINSREKFNR